MNGDSKVKISSVRTVPPTIGLESLLTMLHAGTSDASNCSGKENKNCPSLVGFLLKKIQSTVLSLMSILSTLPM